MSLNAADPDRYRRFCRPEDGAPAFDAVRDFIVRARRRIPEVTATAVTYPGVDIEACRRLAGEMGVSFRPRTWDDVG